PGVAPLSMTLTDSVGLLSAKASGAGTVGGQGTHGLTLTGSLADLNAELASVTYTGGAPGASDAITLAVTDQHGISAPTTIAVDTDPIPVTQPVFHAPDQEVISPASVSALGGLSISNPYSDATGRPLTVEVTSPLLLLKATGGPGGTITGQDSHDLT